MTENPSRRAALLNAAGLVGGGTVAGLLLAGETPASAATPTGQPIAWVGPAGSGAPYLIDTGVGAQGAINSALAATGQGAVYVVGGNYTILAPVVIGNEQTLIGAGPLSTILTAGAGFSGPAMIMTPSGSFTGSRMCIRDIGLVPVSPAGTPRRRENRVRVARRRRDFSGTLSPRVSLAPGS